MLSWDMRGARPPEQNKHKVTKFSLRTCQSFVGRRVRPPNGVRIRGCSRRRRRLLGPRAEGDGGWGPPGGLLAHGPPFPRHGRTPGDGDADSRYLPFTKTGNKRIFWLYGIWSLRFIIPPQKCCKQIVDCGFNFPFSTFPFSWAFIHCFHFPTISVLQCCMLCGMLPSKVGCLTPTHFSHKPSWKCCVDCSLFDAWHFCSAANVPDRGGPMVYGLWIHYNQWPILVAALFVFLVFTEKMNCSLKLSALAINIFCFVFVSLEDDWKQKLDVQRCVLTWSPLYPAWCSLYLQM